MVVQLYLAHVGGLRAFRTIDDVKLHLIAFVQALETFGLDSGVMHEHIRTAILFNEPEPFLVIEPLHFSCSHLCYSYLSSRIR